VSGARHIHVHVAGVAIPPFPAHPEDRRITALYAAAYLLLLRRGLPQPRHPLRSRLIPPGGGIAPRRT
jgi:hypothetical protein